MKNSGICQKKNGENGIKNYLITINSACVFLWILPPMKNRLSHAIAVRIGMVYRWLAMPFQMVLQKKRFVKR